MCLELSKSINMMTTVGAIEEIGRLSWDGIVAMSREGTNLSGNFREKLTEKVIFELRFKI